MTLKQSDVGARAARDVIDECESAMRRNNAFNSAHEGYAVLLGEVDELWDHVKEKARRRDVRAMRHEAVQVGAMALRFIIDCCEEV
jgi:hypothetical protein